MIYLYKIECPKCKGELELDQELTIQEYIEFYNNGISLEEIRDVLPYKKPDYLMFKCNNVECNNVQGLTEQEVLSKLKDSWAKTAWGMTKRLYQTMEGFDGHFTRYTMEKELGKFITEEELENHPILKRYKDLVDND
jgi:uncharacterized protein YbaR (Trm112 family)